MLTPEEHKEMERLKAESEINLRNKLAVERTEHRKKTWQQIVGELYAEEFDAAKSSMEPAKLSQILEFPSKGKGLCVIGESRRGKSRACFHRLRDFYLDDYLSIKCVTGIEFATKASAAFKDPAKTQAWLLEFSSPSLLYIDDFGKRFNITTAEALHEIFEERCKTRKPTWLSTNLTSELIKKLLKDEPHLANSLIERIKEFCDVVVL